MTKTKKWRVLDLYCCAGGAARGYELGGFDEIVGVDKVWKKEYPYEFIQADIEDFIFWWVSKMSKISRTSRTTRMCQEVQGLFGFRE